MDENAPELAPITCTILGSSLYKIGYILWREKERTNLMRR
jgi:hypothetical protein